LQTSTSTGRLSSRDPNLQNIPIRSDLGGKIREAFIAPEGCLLVSADYSQIELRIFASLSGDKNLIRAFRNGEDIHTATAREIFGAEGSREQRIRAKAINFGLIYGKSAYGLAQELSISQEEATNYIKTYFERYPQVRAYMDELVARAHKVGYSETIFGRRRYLPELASKNPALRNAAERAAINMPIQGTAADLLKLAMIGIESKLSERPELGRMLLTVHDELIFEVEAGQEKELTKLVKPIMEGVTKLAVPIVVETGVGKNWLEAH
jgi:DNA polymerase-1